MEGTEHLVGSGGSCLVPFGNATYSLSQLAVNSFWAAQDNRNDDITTQIPYTYYFNFCGPVGVLPDPSCATTGPGQQVPPSNTWPAAAFQVANSTNVGPDDKCHRLSGDIVKSASSSVRYSLYDQTNPAAGIVVTYFNGDRCGLTQTKRQMRIWLQCYNDAVTLPNRTPVIESSGCTYDQYTKSIYGCPLQCPRTVDMYGNVNLCANHGVCDYDAVLGSPRCFCNNGYTGASCDQVATLPVAPSKGLTAVGGVLIAVSLLLVVTLAFLVVIWRRVKSLRLDPTAYSALQGEATAAAHNAHNYGHEAEMAELGHGGSKAADRRPVKQPDAFATEDLQVGWLEDSRTVAR